MTMVRAPGMMFPGTPAWTPNGAGGLGTPGLIDATGEKFAWWGQVRWFDGAASKALRKFHFFPGTVTSAGGSGLTLSVQDMDLTTGFGAPRPDGTIDQSVNFNINTITSSTWFISPALGADRTVSPGDLIAIVIEYDGGGRLGADALNFNQLTTGTAPPGWMGQSFFNGSTWAGSAFFSCCQLEFADGTFGQLGHSLPITNFAQTSFNTGSAADEFALRFQVPFNCVCDGCYVHANTQAINRNFSVNLYDGSTNLLATVTVDSELTLQAIDRFDVTFPSEITLTRNQTYYLSVKGLSASNISVAQFTMANSSYLANMEGGAELYQATRKGGAWTTDQTIRPNFGVRLSQVDDGSGAGAPPSGPFKLEGIGSSRY